MKRSLDSSDSLGALMSICPTTDEQSPRNNHVYGREFQSMLDGFDEESRLEEAKGHVSEKKRRLSTDQVKALEKNFEVENKLEPERKVKLAQELGLQPRQVAVWFQNRRARWKTKQLERDYVVLQGMYDSLKINYDNLQHDNEALLKEIKELKLKLNEENTQSESNISVKEEKLVNETDNNSTTLEERNKPTAAAPVTSSLVAASEPDQELNYESFNNNDNGVLRGAVSLFPDFKDGSSDSDSSAILNGNNSPNAAVSSSGTTAIIQNQHLELLMSPPSSSLRQSPPSMKCFEFSKPTYQTQFVKMEEHNFFGDETCNFFSDDQPPSLQWYCTDQWT